MDSISKTEAHKKIKEAVFKKQPYFIVTANVENIYKAYKNPKLNKVFEKADIVTADGAGVLLAGKIIGSHFLERITGVDLSEELFKIGEKEDFRFYFLGTLPEILEKAVKNLRKRYPKLKIVGYQSGGSCSEDGYFDNDENIVKDIKNLKPNFVLVGLGCPKQEHWIQRHKDKFGAVCIGIGGSFDFWSGKEKRAPKLVQKAGLEWFYRLVQNPSLRFKRFFVLPKFFYLIFKEKISH